MDMRWFAYFVSTTACTGMLARNGKWGGTFGAFSAGVVQVILLHSDLWFSWIDIFVLAMLSFWLGLVSVEPGEAYLLARDGPRRRHTGDLVEHDFNETNIDEFHGQLLAGTSAFVVAEVMPGVWYISSSLVISFVVFRWADAKKIGWVRDAEKLEGAWGIMLDDTVAGVYGFLAGLLPLISLFWR